MNSPSSDGRGLTDNGAPAGSRAQIKASSDTSMNSPSSDGRGLDDSGAPAGSGSQISQAPNICMNLSLSQIQYPQPTQP
jgi:hypothetical protein